MKRALVLGTGVSGRAAIEFFLARGIDVIGVDRAQPAKPLPCKFLLESQVDLEDGYDMVIVSPGIPPSNPIYQMAIRSGIEVLGEAELAFRQINNPVIAVTGTNGKSTAVSAITHVLHDLGREVECLGNIGDSLISRVGKMGSESIVVAELSSFQLETMRSKSIDVGAFLNLTNDHLDRHGDMESYLKAKLRIVDCMKDNGELLVNSAIPNELPNAFKGLLYLAIDPTFEGIPKELLGHEVAIAFAWEICFRFGVSIEDFQRSIKTFKPLAHRMQFVASVKGIDCYNDSKGTNVGAMLHAVEVLETGVILLCGGRWKGGDFSRLSSQLSNSIRCVVTFGEAGFRIASVLGKNLHVIEADTMEDAIGKGLKEGRKGDKLILSPGCSSFDAFRDFEERGEAFIRGIEHESKRYYPNCCSR